MLILSRSQVEALLDVDALLAGLHDGFAALAANEVNAPPRNEIALPDEAFLLSMPGRLRDGPLVVKNVTVFESNLQRDLPSHLATFTLYDPDSGECLAFMDGTYITAIRTSAAAAAATDLLAREDATTLAIIGAGVQGEHHLQTFPRVRDFEDIRIASLYREDAERLAATHPNARATTIAQAVRGADVVALATHAAQPVIDPDHIEPGTHVSSVGYRPPDGELPRSLLDRATLFVEAEEAFAPPPVGCSELQGRTGTLLGDRAQRTHRDEITVYKAMGHVMEDIVAAELVYAQALQNDVGLKVNLT
jgi:alanine dehydrogenase